MQLQACQPVSYASLHVYKDETSFVATTLSSSVAGFQLTAVFMLVMHPASRYDLIMVPAVVMKL
jgi:hypothetical protein